MSWYSERKRRQRQKPPDDEPVAIPDAFLRSLSNAELGAAIQRGYLDKAQCAKLWRMTDRQEAPPDRLDLVFRREDVMRLWP